MPYAAKHRFARISPRKARLVMDLIRGRDVDDAIAMLKFSKQRASGMVEKVIRSAVANANEQETANIRNTLFVAKRGRTRARSSSGSSRRTAARRTRSTSAPATWS